MTIGDTSGYLWRMYVIPKTLDKTLTDTQFNADYNLSRHVTSFKVDGTINKLAYFEATLIGINTPAQKLLIKVGSIVYILAGQKLIGKFVLNKPIYSSDQTVQISGYQSTGSNIISRQLANEGMNKISFKNNMACDILTSATQSCPGILIDNNLSPILQISPTACLNGGCDRFDVSFDYHNRLEALNKFAATTNQEWWIDYGTNDATPYSEGDVLNVKMKMGSAVSTKTFYVGGPNTNARISTGGEDIETNTNHVILQGQDQQNSQITSETFDATSNVTPLMHSLDGWLAADITDGTSDPGKTYIPLTPDSICGLKIDKLFDAIPPTYGEFVIGTEVINACCIVCPIGSPYGPCLTNFCRGFMSEATPHKKGDDVIYNTRFEQVGGGWINIPINLYVCDSSVFCQSTPIIGSGKHHYAYIGNEIVEIESPPVYYNQIPICRTANQPTGLTFYPGDRYAHGNKVLIRDGGMATRTANCPIIPQWTPASAHNQLTFDDPITAINSSVLGLTSGSTADTVSFSDSCVLIKNISGDFLCGEFICGVNGGFATICTEYNTNTIQQNGLFSKTIADNTANNRHMLDLQAQRILLTKQLPVKRITLNPVEAINTWKDVSLGDIVTLGNGSQIGFSDGELVRVTGYNFQWDETGLLQLALYCNDPDTTVYASTDATYTDEKISTETAKQQIALRDFNKLNSEQGDVATSPNCWSTGVRQYKDVMSPTEDYDAVNLKYMKSYVCCCGGGGSGGGWTLFDNGGTCSVKLTCNGDALPFKNGDPAVTDTGNYLGLANCMWYGAWSGYLWANFIESEGISVRCNGSGAVISEYIFAGQWADYVYNKGIYATLIGDMNLGGCRVIELYPSDNFCTPERATGIWVAPLGICPSVYFRNCNNTANSWLKCVRDPVDAQDASTKNYTDVRDLWSNASTGWIKPCNTSCGLSLLSTFQSDEIIPRSSLTKCVGSSGYVFKEGWLACVCTACRLKIPVGTNCYG